MALYSVKTMTFSFMFRTSSIVFSALVLALIALMAATSSQIRSRTGESGASFFARFTSVTNTASRLLHTSRCRVTMDSMLLRLPPDASY
ncbi:hypothetical protein D1872_308110 [compost metagenome]